jgi:hypothetical protein
VVPETDMQPDRDAIRRDLVFMTRRWGELTEPAQFELRAFGENRQPQIGRFQPDWIDDAVDWAANMNKVGLNVYAVRNPIRASVTKSATDADIVAALFLWADCDEPAAAGNVSRFDGPKWSANVTTGRTPDTRVHVYWELDVPCTDLGAWRQLQSDIAAHFRSDPSVINPSRIMRIGGTINWPATHKRAKGYITELCTLRTEYSEPRAPVSFDQMRRVFPVQGATQTRTDAPQGGFSIETGSPTLDRERARIQALQGQEWHNSVIRLVASYVARGLSDDEIHGLTDPLTLAGYTVDQTRREVQTAIDGARRKGWTPPPQEYARPDFDTAQPDAAVTSRALEWFDEIEPALSDSYLVKGVIAGGAMSVVYGPSNSGKTFFAMDLAFHIAAGLPAWCGRRIRQAGVLYLAAEGGRGAANRIVAMREEYGVCKVPFALRRAGLDLLKNEADLNSVATLAQEVKARAPGLPLLIVIDTLSRIMAGGDENSAQDMTALIRNIDAIREHTGAHIMLIHHSGKDVARGARGHSSLRAATDTEVEVSNEDGARAATVTKQRDYQGGETFAFSLKSVPLGFDQDGDEVTTCVVQHEDGEDFKAARAAKKGLGGNQKLIAETFDQMVAEGMARPNPGGVGMPEVGRFWCVQMADLRTLSMGKMAASNKRGAFSEAWRALTDGKGLFCAASDLVWRIDRPKK